MRRWVLLGLLLVARPAWADAGEIQAGVTAAWQIVRAGRLGLAGEIGISDFAAVRLEAEAALGAGGWQGLGAVGPTFYWDVATWVPSATVAVGVGNVQREAALRLLVRGEMRRYVSPRWWFSVGVAEECLVHKVWQCGPLISTSVFHGF